MIAAELDGHRLEDGAIVSILFLLLLAGNLTTTDLIGNGIVLMLRHPEELAKVRADPALARAAVEEILRYDPPVIFARREVTSDQEVLGCPVTRGTAVVPSLEACNRDPTVFEDPHVFRIDRPLHEHLTFGGGIHKCVGAPLARLEAEIAFSRLFTRFRGLRPTSDDLVRKQAHAFKGYVAVPLSI